MFKKRKNLMYASLFVGAGLLVYVLISNNNSVYPKITGLVLLMLGLYSVTQQWTMEPAGINEEREVRNEKNGENS